MPGEHQARSEGDDHQQDVIELARPVGAAVEDHRYGEHDQGGGESDARFGQAQARITGRAGAAPRR